MILIFFYARFTDRYYFFFSLFRRFHPDSEFEIVNNHNGQTDRQIKQQL